MKTEQQTNISRDDRQAAQQVIRLEDLWLDTSIPEENLIEVDPLDIDDRMVEEAENPELEDLVIGRLPKQAWEFKPKHLWLWRLNDE